MTTRIARLEVQMGHVQLALTKLSDVPADIAGIRAQMVTKDYLGDSFSKHTKATLAIVGLMIAVATLINAFAH